MDGSYSVSDIQDFFEYILKKHEEKTDKPSVQTYVNKIENRVTFKLKMGIVMNFKRLKQLNYLEAPKIKHLTQNMMKL